VTIGKTGVANYANTTTGAALDVCAETYSGGVMGQSVGGPDVTTTYVSGVPAGALYTRADSPLLDRFGNYLTVRA
jgi:hypothetical protein